MSKIFRRLTVPRCCGLDSAQDAWRKVREHFPLFGRELHDLTTGIRWYPLASTCQAKVKLQLPSQAKLQHLKLKAGTSLIEVLSLLATMILWHSTPILLLCTVLAGSVGLAML